MTVLCTKELKIWKDKGTFVMSILKVIYLASLLFQIFYILKFVSNTFWTKIPKSSHSGRRIDKLRLRRIFYFTGKLQQIYWLLIHDPTMVFCCQNCSDLLWKKFVLANEKNFWNSRLKAEKFWDHYNNLFKSCKVRTIFGNRTLIQLVPGGF
jgi:hypothetical protein